ncbi:MAG: hypothetical protein QOG68_2015 [Solirubrobacteraceae bacterium]|nr:hypothetical protein [Solirubrobacteraceae bacterium]
MLGRRSRKRKPSATLPKAPDVAAAPPDRYARSRARDEAVRRELEPLALGERPGAVTVAAVFAMVMATANVVAALTGNYLGSHATSYTVLSTAILVSCAAGMWFGARYWAVLGFMMVLVFQMLTLSFALIRVRHWWGALIIVVVVALLGWMFWRLIRALARIQMPERPQPRSR